MLDFLREARISSETKIEIFLYEDLVDDAIQATERYTSPQILARVMDATIWTGCARSISVNTS
ncbi:MAG TPA: hypothetical protein P5326_05075 [Candidatus Contendobacter sp.]|nr:hypothetical protein [Candidatus Contendobacter sp.]